MELPPLSSKLLTLVAMGVLVFGVLAGFWNGFVTDGPDDFTDKIAIVLSTMSTWALSWAVLMVAAVLAGRNER